jgi:multiple sugar transport system substrate-binding protein
MTSKNILNGGGISRRQFLKHVGAGAAAASMLSSLPLLKALAQGDTEKWTSGTVPHDIKAPFNWTGWEGQGEIEKWQLAFDKFFKANYPNVQVTGNPGVEWASYWTTLPAQLAGGTPIDMAWMHDSRVKTFASKGWLKPLDEYLTAFAPNGWPGKFWASQVKAFQYNGKQYAFPYDWAPGGLYVNKDMFKAAGLELPTENWTFDDIRAAAIKLTKDTNGDGKPDQWGVSLPASNWSGGDYWVVKCFGGEFFNEDATESRLNNPKTIEALQFLADLMWKDKVMPTAENMTGLGFSTELAFSSGLIGMFYALNDTAKRFVDTIGDKFKWTVAPSPKGPAGRFQFLGGSAFSIPSTSTQPEIAYELIRYTLTNKENLPTMAGMGSAFLSNKDFADNVLPKDSPIRADYLHTFRELGDRDGVYPNYHPKYLEWETSIWGPVFDRLWVGEELDAAKLAQDAHDQTNKLLKGA